MRRVWPLLFSLYWAVILSLRGQSQGALRQDRSEDSICWMMNDELSVLFVKELSRGAGSAEETSTMAPSKHKSSLRRHVMKYGLLDPT